MDRELIEKAKKVKSKEELRVLLDENKLDIPDEKIDELYCQINSYGEIGDDDLDKVSGGHCAKVREIIPGFDCAKYSEGQIVRIRAKYYIGNGVSVWCPICKSTDNKARIIWVLADTSNYGSVYRVKCIHNCFGEETVVESDIYDLVE